MSESWPSEWLRGVLDLCVLDGVRRWLVPGWLVVILVLGWLLA